MRKIGGFILPAVIFWGCISDPTEEGLIDNQSSKIEMKGETLSFSNFESYDKAIQDPKEIISLKFPSLAKFLAGL